MFRKNIDTEQVALTVIAMIEGATMIERVTGNRHGRTTIMNSVNTLVKPLE